MTILVGLSSCPAPAPIEVDINFTHSQPAYVRSQSARSLSARKSTPARPGRRMTLGLTEGKLSYNYQASYDALTQNDSGATCFVLRSLRVDIKYKPTIFIASDYRVSGCALSVIDTHENKHVAIDMRAIRETLPRLKRDMMAAAQDVGARGPFPRRMLYDEKKRASKPIFEKLKAVMRDLSETRLARHEIIDSDENYAREMAPCRRSH
jgi:hypothetical protein